MGLYNKIGGYAGYDKNNKERDALDYYSTPIEEVENILNIVQFNLNNSNILEPCCGGGHMVKGIYNYINKQNYDSKLWKLFATDIQKRNSILDDQDWKAGKEYDFLSDDYPYTKNIDYIIMNPPYSVIEPFTLKALSIANKGVLMLGRLQFLEGEKRYLNIFQQQDNQISLCPDAVYIYVDRINCYKNGNTTMKQASAQAYAWFYWNCLNTQNKKNTNIYWIRRMNKQK